MVILTKRCWFRGYFREAQSLVVILAKSFGFVAKIAKLSLCGGGGGFTDAKFSPFLPQADFYEPC